MVFMFAGIRITIERPQAQAPTHPAAAALLRELRVVVQSERKQRMMYPLMFNGPRAADAALRAWIEAGCP